MVFSNRDLEKENRWQEIIGRQKQSGQGIVEFCKQEGLRENQFYYWRGILAKRLKIKNQLKRAENKIDIPFVPLSLPDKLNFSNQQNSSEQIEISKVTVRVSAGADKSTLACILQSLEKA